LRVGDRVEAVERNSVDNVPQVGSTLAGVEPEVVIGQLGVVDRAEDRHLPSG
jgi:hypothetical protein